MDTIDRIIELLNSSDYTQKDLTDYLGIQKSVFSAWKSKKSKSYNKYLTQIATFFNVSVEDLKIYELKKAAIKKNGFFWEVQEREELKETSRMLISTTELTDEELVNNAVIILKALFSRSIETSMFSTKHVDFETYSAMILKQGEQQRLIFGELSDIKYKKIYNLLVQKFGKKEGIPTGTYYSCEQHYSISNEKTTKNKSVYSNEEKLIIKKYRELDIHGRDMVDTVIEKEYERCTAVIEEENPEIIQIKLSQLPASAGTGVDLSEENYQIMSIRASDLARQADFAVRVSGDSMETTFYDGDILLIESMPFINKGDIGIFVLNGDGYVKEYGGDRLISHNKKYPDIRLTEHDVVICSGRVIGVLEEDDFIN